MIDFRKLLTVWGLLILSLSCNKEDTPNNNNGTRGFTPQPETNTLRALFVTTIERDVPFGTRYLTVFEPNGTVRWKKAIKGPAFNNGNITYGNGMIYSTEL